MAKLEKENEFDVISQSYSNINDILNIEEDIEIISGSIMKQFRWSHDGIVYSNWIELDLSNMNDYVEYLRYDDIYIQYRITLLEEGEVNVNSLTLEIETREDEIIKVPSVIADRHTKILPVKDIPFSFRPYAATEVVNLQNSLNYDLNKLYGIETLYCKKNPRSESRDPILNEYSLYDVADPICLKVILDENEIPNNNYIFTQMGIDFEYPLEVSIDKLYYESVIGKGKSPQKGDIFIFDILKQAFVVESSMLDRALLGESTFYKLSLTKYYDQSNTTMSDSTSDLLDEKLIDTEELFGEELDALEEKISNTQQTEDQDLKTDPIREHLIKPYDMFKVEKVENFINTISRYHYDLNSIFKDNDNQYLTAIKYKANSTILEDQTRIYTSWFRERTLESVPRSIIDVTEVSCSENIDEYDEYDEYDNLPEEECNNRYLLNFDILPFAKEGQWIYITDTNINDFEIYAKVVEVDIDKKFIKIQIPEYIMTNANISNSSWTSSSTLRSKEIAIRNFINAHDGDKGYRIDTIDSKYFRILLNDLDFWIPIDLNISKSEWYGLVIRIDNRFKEISIHLYERYDEALKTTKLKRIFSHLESGIPNIDRKLDKNIEIELSPLNLTNIRLMSSHIADEDHSNFLNRNIITDAQYAIIIDNAEPKELLPYMGDSK